MEADNKWRELQERDGRQQKNISSEETEKGFAVGWGGFKKTHDDSEW